MPTHVTSREPFTQSLPHGIRLEDGDQPHILTRYLTPRSFSPPTLCGPPFAFFPPLSFFISAFVPATTYKPATMAGTDTVISTPYNTAIQEFSNSNSTPKRSRRRAATLLRSKELLRSVQGLTPEDKTRFVDKLDQVCRTAHSSLLTPLHHSRKDISNY